MSTLLDGGPSAQAGGPESQERPEDRAARMRRRRRLLAWGLLPVLAALLVAAKLLGMSVFAQQAIWAFDAKDGAGVSSAADGMGVADVVETHKSHFARGDAYVLAGDYARARAAFEEALRRTGPDDECTVRVNLVLSIEKLADAANVSGDTARATSLYDEGLAVVEAAPEGCFQPNGPLNQRQQGERLGEAEERMRRERAEAQPQPGKQPQGPSGTQPGPAPSPSQDPAQAAEEQAQQDRLKELGQKSETGQQERAEGEQRRDYLETPPQAPVDRPW
ncbi:tetratricopeptide repeat protein [Sinomonas mesophila]|uniref:tetratricopeptide repeat protein n=1 Tax=Sinomonas mesophila TaxID=1531955 RepID=UPI000984666B|nr:tetratricopeptide repeat protein [Sinomonas mesophila]